MVKMGMASPITTSAARIARLFQVCGKILIYRAKMGVEKMFVIVSETVPSTLHSKISGNSVDAPSAVRRYWILAVFTHEPQELLP